jgi:hypothetical protein
MRGAGQELCKRYAAPRQELLYNTNELHRGESRTARMSSQNAALGVCYPSRYP